MKLKKITKILLLFLFVFSNTFAQQEKGIIGSDNWLNRWTNFSPKNSQHEEPTQILRGVITNDTHLYKGETYLLVGNVMVVNNATLTIEPGSVILGDYNSTASLTITKGAKIIAEGTETDPIVFSSNRSVKRSGDWGGIIVLGDAPTNKFGNGSVASFYPSLNSMNMTVTNYGGENLEDTSGILKYVRIEYAGKRQRAADQFNALLLAGVGNKTVVENIMISYSANNSFEVWGGNLSITKAVTYKSSGNDFSFNYGAQANLINSLAVRSPYTSTNEKSRCLKIKSYNEKTEVDFTKKGTAIYASNLTFFNNSENVQEDIDRGLVNEGIFVGHNTTFEIKRSVISGFNPAVVLDENIKVNQESLDKIKLHHVYFNNCNGNIFVENNANNDDLENWYGNRAFFNLYSKSPNSETFIASSVLRKPDYRLRINKIMASTD